MASFKSLEPDAIFLNAGGMITMAGDATPALYRNLTAIAVREGVIVGLGSDEAIIRNSPDALVTDLEGTVLMPGLIDSHNHFLRTALDWERLQLGDVRSTEELLDAVGQRAREISPGQWLLCSRRWHETNLAEGRMPTAQQLDRAAPNNPVYLPRGGHVVVTNSLGLERAGISHDSADPEGGSFVRDAAGVLTGMMVEMPAFSKVTRLLPQTVEDDRRRALRAGIKAYNQAGITTVRDPGLGAAEFRSYQAVLPQERSLRASLMWRLDLGATPDDEKPGLTVWRRSAASVISGWTSGA